MKKFNERNQLEQKQVDRICATILFVLVSVGMLLCFFKAIGML